MRGVWIEMSLPVMTRRSTLSLPMRGVWIEM